jgi:hypothetical protein
MRSIFGEGESPDGKTFPLPEICFAALRKFRPTLKGRVNLLGFSKPVFAGRCDGRTAASQI